MINYKELLVSKINDYNIKKISREDLSNWAEHILNSFLKNRELVYYDKFAIYPFISNLAIKKESLEFLSDRHIQEYLEILNGNRNMKYDCYMKVPRDIQTNPIKDILEFVDSYNIISKISDGDYEMIDKYSEIRKIMKINTVVDFLFCDIISILSDLPTINNAEICANSIYLGVEDLKVDELKNRLARTIECYKGDREFRLNLSYNMGNSILNISV